jgi:hypothetical protein
MPGSGDDADSALVALVADGDEAAFSVFYRRYLPLVTRWCLRETGNRELAADLSAEVFAAALRASRRYRPERVQDLPVASIEASTCRCDERSEQQRDGHRDTT